MAIGRLLVIAIIVSGAACAPKEQRLPDFRLSNGANVSEVRLLDGTLFFRSAALIGECNEIRSEVRDVWMQVGRQEAAKRSSNRFTMVPEDRTGRSRTFDYMRRDGEWTEWNFFDRDCSSNGQP